MVLKNQEWIKSITDVKKIAIDQEPYLSLKINGKWAIIFKTQKYSALMNGILAVIGDTDKLSVKDQFYLFQARRPAHPVRDELRHVPQARKEKN